MRSRNNSPVQRSLFVKYFSICSLIIIISITILGVVLMSFASSQFKQDKYNLLMRNAQQAVNLTLSDFKSHNYKYVNQSVVLPGFLILSTSVDADIFLVDVTGKTLLCTDSGACNHTTYLVNGEIIQKIMEQGQYQEVGKLGGMYPELYYNVGVPVYSDSLGVVGFIFASTSAQQINDFLAETAKAFLLTAMAVMLVSFVLIYFVTNGLVRPLRDMVSATQSFSKGDFSVRVPVNSFDEIGRLAIAFNNMASSLAELESVRRSFTANVSHELKTPMTTISGFIDGILDGTIPDEKRNQYLHIVSDEVKRLSRLVRSMLNIARIEAGEMKINPIDVDINDIVCRTVFTFEQSIESKEIDIRGLETEKVLVHADPDLIHQVVYNLVENAVKFTNQGGFIQISYQTDGTFTYVCIKNSGEGISKDEISKIFDRFYKTDKSRSLDKNGVGLGLYIVKTIVNMHRGEIIVRSAQGEYSEFIFSVPNVSTKSSLPRFRKNDKQGTIGEQSTNQ